MNEETQNLTEPAAAEQPATTETKTPEGFKLDWDSVDISLKGGRFVHTLGRPSHELILERDKKIETEIPISKDGGFAMPDPTETEEIDAECYASIQIDAKGYKGVIPETHRAAAFQGLYVRSIYVHEDCDIFGDEIVVCEDIGDPDDPAFSIHHILNAPEETDIKKLRRKFNNGRLVPDKRGRQKFVSSSVLKTAMQNYSAWFKGMSGAHCGGENYTDERRAEFLAAVDPLIQQKVVKTVVDELTGGLLD